MSRRFKYLLAFVLWVSLCAIARSELIGPMGSGSSGVGCTGCTTNTLLKWTGSALGNSSVSDNGTVVNATEPLTTGASPPNVTVGTGGIFACAEGTPPTTLAGTDILWCDNSAHAIKEFANGSATGNILVADSAGTVESSFGVSGALGGLTSTAAATLLQTCDIAVAAGHFTNLVETNDLNAATCTTAPTFNVRDNTGGTTGTAKTASTTAGVVNQTQTLTFNAGDTICIVRTINGGTCTAPIFSVVAHISYP